MNEILGAAARVRLAGVRGRLSGQRFNAAMQGASSGLHVTAMAVPVLAGRALATELRVPEAALIACAQAAPLALSVALWGWVRRGAMLSRLAVSGLWAVGGLALLGMILIPAWPEWAVLVVASVLIAFVGAGPGVNYHVQGNTLGRLVEQVRATFAGGNAAAGAVSAAVREAVGVATGRWKRWELLVGFITAELVSGTLGPLGAKVTVAGFAGVLIAFAGLHFCWGGMPDARRGAKPPARVGMLLVEDTELRKQAAGALVLYGVWGALYPVVALLGAIPLVQASIGGLARGVAWLFVVWLGRLAGKHDQGQGVVGILGILAAAGTALLALSGPAYAWAPAGLGVCMAELGCTAMASALKSRLADSADPARIAQLVFQFRFVGYGLWSLLLTLAWPWLSHDGARAASRTVACVLVVLVIAARKILVRRVHLADRASITVVGEKELVLLVFPRAPRAQKTWFWIGIAGGVEWSGWFERGRRLAPEGAFFGLRSHQRFTVGRRRRYKRRLLELRCLGSHGRRAQAGSRSPDICERWHGGPLAGTLRMLTRAPVTVTFDNRAGNNRPAWIGDVLGRRPGEMGPDVKLDAPLMTYTILSGVLEGELTVKCEPTILPGLFGRRKTTHW